MKNIVIVDPEDIYYFKFNNYATTLIAQASYDTETGEFNMVYPLELIQGRLHPWLLGSIEQTVIMHEDQFDYINDVDPSMKHFYIQVVAEIIMSLEQSEEEFRRISNRGTLP